MKIPSKDHVFSDQEIRSILQESEGRQVGGRPPGHTVARHELFSPFDHRTNIYLQKLRGRFLEDGEQKIGTSGAFQNGLVPALVFTFSQNTGRRAIEAFVRPENAGVKLLANIANGNFRIVYYQKADAVLNPDGKSFAPLTGDAEFWKPRTGTAEGIFVILLKTDDDQVHIQTAYPIARLSQPPSCKMIPK